MFYSPLRYPGGKSKIATMIAEICLKNHFNHHFVEPYAGGASVALYLLVTKKVQKITLNDYDRSIYALWYAILNQTEALCSLIERTHINVENWEQAKAIQQQKQHADLLTLGFSTLFLNRTNRSGILGAGFIGGKKQTGKYKMDCRFNKREIIKRIKLIAQHRAEIDLYNLDALDLIERFDRTKTMFYFDPPYYIKGDSLYACYYNHEQHVTLSECIKNIKDAYWILSYDNVKEIGQMYDWVEPSQQKEYLLFHRASTKKQGKEILFFSDKLHLQPLARFES